MKKLFLLFIPITLITLCGCSDDTSFRWQAEQSCRDNYWIPVIYPLEQDSYEEIIWCQFIQKPIDKIDYCYPIYERCIDNYFNDNCLNLYRDWNDIMCEIETWYSIPIREFKCNVCEWNYWMPIDL